MFLEGLSKKYDIIQIKHLVPIKPKNTLFINRWNVLGADFNPKGILKYS